MEVVTAFLLGCSAVAASASIQRILAFSSTVLPSDWMTLHCIHSKMLVIIRRCPLGRALRSIFEAGIKNEK
jgi:hypothetical protein